MKSEILALLFKSGDESFFLKKKVLGGEALWPGAKAPCTFCFFQSFIFQLSGQCDEVANIY